MGKKIITLGEIMLRLSPPENQRFVQARSFEAYYGGGEANVAIALRNFGLDTTFVTRLPQNELGDAVINHLRSFGVDTSYISRGGKRLGLYFLEKGASVRASKVIYDRADSSMAEAKLSDFDFDKIFERADWFHISGITPALSGNAEKIAEHALRKAKEEGLTTSLDLSYRQKLWSIEKAREVINRLCQYVDVYFDAGMGSGDEPETLLGFKKIKPKSGSKNHIEVYKDVFRQMQLRFGFRYMATTLRDSFGATNNDLEALVFDGQKFHLTKRYKLQIVDRVGSGDSFAAGFIYSLITGMRLKDSGEFAVASAALKHTIPGDVNLVSVAEVEALVRSGGEGRVVR